MPNQNAQERVWELRRQIAVVKNELHKLETELVGAKLELDISNEWLQQQLNNTRT